MIRDDRVAMFNPMCVEVRCAIDVWFNGEDEGSDIVSSY